MNIVRCKEQHKRAAELGRAENFGRAQERQSHRGQQRKSRNATEFGSAWKSRTAMDLGSAWQSRRAWQSWRAAKLGRAEEPNRSILEVEPKRFWISCESLLVLISFCFILSMAMLSSALVFDNLSFCFIFCFCFGFGLFWFVLGLNFWCFIFLFLFWTWFVFIWVWLEFFLDLVSHSPCGEWWGEGTSN